MQPLRDANLLVLSDLHLGEDLRPNAAATGWLGRLDHLEREFESFLAHHTGHIEDGKPWRLVINGDMVDFMSVLILPGADEAAASADERSNGLGFGERQTAEKLARVLERHDSVFRHLARFVAAGHDLVIVVGNHDVEFQFPAVQRLMVEALVARGAGNAAERVRFCDWFHHEPGLVYVEHGHQYDEQCAFDYQLHPLHADTEEVALSLPHAGMRWFGNHVPELQPGDAEVWTFPDYVRWALPLGLRALLRLVVLYLGCSANLYRIYARLTNVRQDALRRARHQAALARAAANGPLHLDALCALDALRAAPVIKRARRWLATMYLDRVGLAALGLGGLAALLSLLGPTPRTLWASAAVLALTALASVLVGRGPLPPPEEVLRAIPARIGAIVRVPFIVFGHSHYPESVALDANTTYFNTGTWVADNARGAFTHLVVRRGPDGAPPTAELLQWAEGRSVPYAFIRDPMAPLPPRSSLPRPARTVAPARA